MSVIGNRIEVGGRHGLEYSTASFCALITLNYNVVILVVPLKESSDTNEHSVILFSLCCGTLFNMINGCQAQVVIVVHTEVIIVMNLVHFKY